MKWTDYVSQANEFASYPIDPTDGFGGMTYVFLGVAGEVCEFQDVVKKIYRNGSTTEELKGLLIKEAGDIMWYLSQLEYNNFIRLLHAVDELAEEPTLTSNNYLKDAVDLTSFVYHAMYLNLVKGVRDLVFRLTGKSLKDVMELNIKKLSSRKERGVINGHGDNR